LNYPGYFTNCGDEIFFDKGMGLFMVKTQVESPGGKINIRSQVNKGAEFKIEFQTGTLSENTTTGYHALKLWLAGAGCDLCNGISGAGTWLMYHGFFQ
jgi:hypothetical protein